MARSALCFGDLLREKLFHVTVRAVVSIFQPCHTGRPEFFNSTESAQPGHSA